MSMDLKPTCNQRITFFTYMIVDVIICIVTKLNAMSYMIIVETVSDLPLIVWNDTYTYSACTYDEV